MEILLPHHHSIDPHFTVNRVLPTPRKRAMGPFVFWDHMGPVALNRGDELSVRPHPHIGLATLTFLYEGAILHRDSLGNSQTILAGEANWMVAGKGIVHSERTGPLAENVRGRSLEGIQAWIALPEGKEDIDPSFHHFSKEELPLLDIGTVKMTLIAGTALGARSPVPYQGDIFYLAGTLTKGEKFSFPLTPEREGALYVSRGELTLTNGTKVPQGHMAWQKGGALSCIGSADSTQLILLGGNPLSKPRHMWWNFVHSSKDKMEEAKERWKAQRFPSVPEETEWIPLPE
jgi:redox-sensitive bicupin YhaK (pirin superfamily)